LCIALFPPVEVGRAEVEESLRGLINRAADLVRKFRSAQQAPRLITCLTNAVVGTDHAAADSPSHGMIGSELTGGAGNDAGRKVMHVLRVVGLGCVVRRLA
jgi:hypothetical protein